MSISLSDNSFIPADIIYSKVRRRLQSYSAANLIDEGEFPVYAQDVLKRLRLGVYKECEALTKIEGYKGCLPINYEVLYSAYKCSPEFTTVDKGHGNHLQSSSFSFNTDITDTIFLTEDNCTVDCCTHSSKAIESICVKTSVHMGKDLRFGCFAPLRLSPNVKAIDCVDDCINKFNTSPLEITISDKTLYTNFTDDYVYIKYYGFPIDDEGNLMIIDIQEVQNAIEWYIVYQTLLDFWLDSSVPDIQNKWQKAEQESKRWFAEAKYQLKLPAFAEMVNSIRTQRSQNKMVYFTRQYSNTNFQRSF